MPRISKKENKSKSQDKIELKQADFLSEKSLVFTRMS